MWEREWRAAVHANPMDRSRPVRDVVLSAHTQRGGAGIAQAGACFVSGLASMRCGMMWSNFAAGHERILGSGHDHNELSSSSALVSGTVERPAAR
jgi:hypothetical protein